MYTGLHVNYPILMKLEFSRQYFEKYSNIKFDENPFSGSVAVPCGWTDKTKLIVAFPNFANARKNEYSTLLSSCVDGIVFALSYNTTDA